MHNVKIFTKLFLCTLIIEFSFTVFELLQWIFWSAKKTPQVIIENMIQSVLKCSSIHNHFVKIIELLSFWSFADWGFIIVSYCFFETLLIFNFWKLLIDCRFTKSLLQLKRYFRVYKFRVMPFFLIWKRSSFVFWRNRAHLWKILWCFTTFDFRVFKAMKLFWHLACQVIIVCFIVRRAFLILRYKIIVGTYLTEPCKWRRDCDTIFSEFKLFCCFT